MKSFIKDGYHTFKISQPFKILQLTDLHIGGSLRSKKADRLALDGIRKVVEKATPNLIILTGDSAFPISIYSGSSNNLKQSKLVGSLLDSFQIPWTFVFGNHDVELFSRYNKAHIARYYSGLKNCIFQCGEEQLSGMGNTIINLENEQQERILALGLLDSNMYAKKSFFSGFDHIHSDQIEWFKREILRLSTCSKLLPSLTFFHIPVTAFKTAWKMFTRGSKEVTYHFGEIGETNDYFGVPRVADTFFEQMVEFQSTRGMFMGHDHLNNASITYKGIRLTYGLSMDFLAYKNIRKYTSQRGGTVITVLDDGTFDVEHIYLDEI